MTFEELRAEWERRKNFCGHPTDNDRPENFAWDYVDKLIAVAEAAQPLSVKTSFNKDSWTQVDELNQSLKDLLGE